MQLTLHADYSLRALLYLTENPGRAVSTQEIADHYRISRHHLVRVLQSLHSHSFIRLSAGRKGGAQLARPAEQINLGRVVRCLEPGFRIVECFDPERNTCPIVARCPLKGILAEALAGFFAVLDTHTLADLIVLPERRRISDLFQIGDGSSGGRRLTKAE